MHVSNLLILINEAAFRSIKVVRAQKRVSWHEDVGEEWRAKVDAFWRGRGDAAVHDLVLEGAEYDEAELDVDVYEAGAVADETFGGGEQVIQADAQADFLNHLGRELEHLNEAASKCRHLVCIFYVDVILDRLLTGLLEIFWCDLNQIGDLRLGSLLEKRHNHSCYCDLPR